MDRKLFHLPTSFIKKCERRIKFWGERKLPCKQYRGGKFFRYCLQVAHIYYVPEYITLDSLTFNIDLVCLHKL